MKRVKSFVKKDSFREQFRESLRYLKESRNYIYTVSLIFLCGIFMGFAFSGQLGFLDVLLKELVDQVKSLDTFGIILFILQNNLKSSLYSMILGIAFGIFPIINSLSNGVLLGYVLHGVWAKSGITDFWRILPHGIFELPAVFISLGLGLKLGTFIFAKDKGKTFFERAKNSMIIFVCIVVPLLIIAAIIEGLLISFYK